MTELSESLKELNELFGKPEDGNTECFIGGTLGNKIFNKEGVDTGYTTDSARFPWFLFNPKGKEIARISPGIGKEIFIGDKNTGYHINGPFYKIYYKN